MLVFAAVSQVRADQVNGGRTIELSAEERGWIEANPVLRVANEDDWPPFDFSEAGKPLGYSIDIADLVAEKTGLNFKYINGYTWTDLYDMALGGELDLLPCIGNSPQRQRDFIMTGAYFDDPIAVFVRNDSPPFRSMRDLLGKKLAVVEGYSVTDNIKNNYPDIHLAYMPSSAAALRAVSEGRADAFADTMSVGLFEIRTKAIPGVRVGGKAKVKGMGDTAFYMAIPKSMPVLASIIQKGLDAVTEEENERLLRKWDLQAPAGDEGEPVFALSDEEKDLLGQLGALKVGVHPGAAPFSFLDEKGEFAGINADVLASAVKRLGLDVKPVKAPDWDKATALLASGELDLVTFAQKRLQEEDAERITQPYMEFPIVVVARSGSEGIAGMESLSGRSIGYVEDLLVAEYVKRDYPDLKLHSSKSPREAFSSLAEGRSEALLVPMTAYDYHDRVLGLDDFKVVSTTPFTLRPSFKVRKGLGPLVGILNKYFASLDLSELTLHDKRWRNIKVDRQVDWGLVLKSVLAVSAVSFLVVVFFVMANRRLAREVEERRKAEKELRVSREFLSTIVDNLPLMVFVKSAEDFRLLRFNREYERVMGRPPEELKGKNNFDLHPEERARVYAAQDAEVATSGESKTFPEQEIATRGRGTRIISTTKIPILGDNGDPQYVLGISEDVTEKKAAENEKLMLEKQLSQAQKIEAIGTLAGGIAHDFNNILSAVLGYTEIVLVKDRLEEEDKVNLEQVLAAAERAKDLVRQILMFSRKGDEDRHHLDLGVVVEEALKLLRQTIPTTISIKKDIDPETGQIVADGTKMHQVIMNLCTNAYHAMRADGGSLSVELKPVKVGFKETARHPDLKVGQYALLSIEDTGVGIAPQALPRIFDPFFTTKETGAGTGLGLSVVHGIVKSHGGAIGVSSEQGVGTRFEVYFPISLEGAAGEAVEGAEAVGGDEHILLVDDEPALLDLGKIMLESLGYTVTATGSPEEALDLFSQKSGDFDLIVTDQTMPRMTGAGLAEEVQKVIKGFPVIICTGYSDVLDEEKAGALGVKALLMKPVDRKNLAAEVRKALDGAA